MEEGSTAKLWTVNGIVFNKRFGTFCTYGSDGNYFFWNKDTKSRLRSNKLQSYPITAADFSEDGILFIIVYLLIASLFAFAFGQDYSKGCEDAKKNMFPVKIYVRKVKEDEVYKKP